jgi:membrane associated rhomboid family serine protease
MFVPVHDNKNSKVAGKPIITHWIIGICFLIFTYQSIIGSAPETSPIGVYKLANFNNKYGLVPAVYNSGKTAYFVDPSIDEKDFNQSIKNENDAKLLGFLKVNTNSLIIWLMPLFFCFLHGSLDHLLSNMWFFWIFSDNVEEKLGKIGYLIFYLFVGAISGIGHAYLNPESTVPLVGASGAISGIMGAYMAFFPKNLITSFFCPIWFFIRRIDVPAFVVLGFYLLINALQANYTNPLLGGVAFDCHIIGFLTGLTLALILKFITPERVK